MAASVFMILSGGALRGMGPGCEPHCHRPRKRAIQPRPKPSAPIPAKRERCSHDPCRDRWTGTLGALAGRIVAGQERASALRARPHQHARDGGGLLPRPRAGADRAVEAARKAGVVLAVGYCRRFHPSVVEVRRRLAEGGLGTVISMVAQHTTSTGQFIAPDNWRAAPEEAPGGALTAVGVHALDHMIEFAGRVRDVRCVTARTIPGPSDDTTTVMLRFEGGATGLIFGSVATATNFSFTLYGSKGLAEISRPNLQTLRFVPTSEQAPTGPVTAPPDEISEHPGFNMLNAELTEFARAIRERRPYPVPIDEVLHGMSVFDAIVQAARCNEIVAVRAR